MYRETNRKYEDVETGKVFTLFMNDNTHEYRLIYMDSDTNNGSDLANGSEVNGFFICAHTGCTVKINGKKQVKLDKGQFYNLKESEIITHKKYTGFNRFTKV